MKEKVTSSLQSAIRAAVVLGAFVAFAAPTQAQQQPPANNWFKVCTKQEENEICNVAYRVIAPTGQIITAVSLLESKGTVNGRKFQVTVLPPRVIPPGIKVQIDESAPITVPYGICFPERCIAEAALDDKLITALKGGGELTLTSVNFQGKPNPVKVTLNGFTAAFDGPPLAQDELAERQRQLQEELRKKAEEQRQRLQDAQQKAKEGTN